MDEHEQAKEDSPTKRRRILLKALLSAAFLSFVLYVGARHSVLATIRDTHPLLLLFSFLSFAALLILEGLRLNVMFASDGLTLLPAFRMSVVSTFFGSMTPGMVGADLCKIHAAGALIGDLRRATVFVGVLRLVSIVSLIAAVALYLVCCHGRIALYGSQLQSLGGRSVGDATVGVLVLVAIVGLAVSFAPTQPTRFEHTPPQWSVISGSCERANSSGLAR